jgi:hypothetical protein
MALVTTKLPIYCSTNEWIEGSRPKARPLGWTSILQRRIEKKHHTHYILRYIKFCVFHKVMQFDPRFGGRPAACINRPYITSINLGELVPFFVYSSRLCT